MGRNVWKGANGSVWLDGSGKVVHEQKVKMGNSLAPGCSEWSPSVAANPWEVLEHLGGQERLQGEAELPASGPQQGGGLPASKDFLTKVEWNPHSWFPT